MEHLNILLVDDDPDIGEMMKLRLATEAPDMSFHFVESGRECLEYLKENKVDCILSDYQMPGMDGMELLRTLREAGDDTPFIFLTGQGDEELARDAFKGGANDYFTKEIGFAHFARIINSVEQAVKQGRALKEKTLAEDALRESGEKYRALVEATNTGFVILDMAGNVVDANEEYVRLTGHNALDEVLGRNVVEWTAAADIERNAAEVKKCMEKGFVRNLEISYAGPDGRLTPIEINANLINDPEGGKILTLCRDITEKKIAEDAFKREKELTDAVIQSIPGVFYVYDSQLRLVRWNRKLEEVLGRSPVASQTHALETIAEEDRERIASKIREILIDHKDAEDELLVLDAKGRKIPYLCTGSPMDVAGSTYLVGVGIDISERRRMEDALHESLEKFRTLFESADDSIFLMEGNTFVDCNPSTVKMFGYTDKSELIGHTPWEYSPGTQPDEMRSETKARGVIEAAYGGAPQRFYWVHRRKDGTPFDAEVSLNRITLKQKTYLLAIVRDITGRKRAEKLTKLLKHSIDASPDGAYWLDTDNRIIYANDAGCAILGYERDELIGKTVFDVNPTASPARMEEVWATLRDKGVYASESVHRRKDGSEFPVEITTSYFVHDGREYACGYARDITERKIKKLAVNKR